MIATTFDSNYIVHVWGCDVMVAMRDSKSRAEMRVSSTLTTPTMKTTVDTLDKNFVANKGNKSIVFESSLYRLKTIKSFENKDELYFLQCA